MSQELPAPDLLDKLTFAQKDAVMHRDGPLLILAGAGSGKTRVITRRVAWLLQEGARASNILAITFTNKAASEMRQRVESLVPGNRVWISTFHALGAKLLRIYGERIGLDKNFTIYDMDDRNRVIKNALAAAGIDSVRFTPERIGSAISKAKNQLLTPAKYSETASDFFTQTVAQTYGMYQKLLRDSSGLDFDDLLYIPAMVLKTNEELRAELDERFRYVLIDEYQDTNQAQYEIAKNLSRDHRNLCVVGDPDQCLPSGTMVSTPSGLKPIETLRDGDEVLSGIGWGKVAPMRIDKVMINPHRGKIVRISVEGGITLRATPNHVCFVAQASSRGARSTATPRWAWSTPSECGNRVSSHPNGVLQAQRGVAVLRAPLDETRPLNELDESVRFTEEEDFIPSRADNIREGMIVPVVVGGSVQARQVLSIAFEDYDGPVYDLSVPNTRNFVANGLVVHNSIYRWRGSDIRNILDFERDFPDARVITLDKNYRSTKAILKAASTLIEHNTQRKKKALLTDNAEGDPVRVLTFDNGLDEAGMIAKKIRESVNLHGRKYRDFAVFVRINALTRTLESAFIKEGIPFQIVKGLAFFERKENRDILAYLRLLVNPLDSISFARVVNEPPRGIGKVSLEHLAGYAEQYQLSLLAAAGEASKIKAIKGKALAGLQEFAKLIHKLRESLELPPDQLIRQVIDESGYRESLQNSDNEEDQDRLANVEELITAARQFAEQDASLTIRDFLEQVTLASDVDGYDERQDCVSMMTLHAAKGLEFPVVYMIAVEEGILPHSRALESRNPEDIEEERRLAFVGMTRAMRELYLSHAKSREFRGSIIDAISSGFLQELPETVEKIDHCRYGVGGSSFDRWRGSGASWSDTGVQKPKTSIKPAAPVIDSSGYFVGQIVQHEEYGIGQITDISGLGSLKKLKIRFGKGGEKSFVASMVKLKVVPPRGNP